MTSLPDSMTNFSKLTRVSINNNPLTDLSVLQYLPLIETIEFLDVYLNRRRYLSKLNEWNPQWLLDENNSEIRRVLIEQLGYENNI